MNNADRVDRRRLVGGLFLVFVLALGVRLAYLDGMEGYPRFEAIKNRLDDQVVFDAWGKKIAAGEPFDYATTGHEFAHWAAAHPGVYPQAPLYPWWIGLNYRLWGPRYDTVRALQMALGALGCCVLVLVARRFVAPWATWLSGLAAAFYGPLVFYEGTYLRAAVTTPVLLSGLALALATADAMDGHRKPRALGILALATGFVFALLVLLRANNLLVAGVVVVWLIVRRGLSRQAQLQQGPSQPSRRAVVVGFGLGLALPLTLVAGLNTVRSGSPAFLSSNGPYILFVSNVHDATGLGAGVPPTYFEVKAKGPAGSIDLVAETLADIRRHPGAWLRLEGRKLVAFFAPHEIPNNLSYAMARETNPRLAWAPLDLRWVLPLAALGILVSLTDLRRHLLLHGVLWSSVVGTILFYVLARLRLPLVPILLIFAALALDTGVRAWRRGRWKPLALGVGAVVGLTVLLWPGPRLHRPTDYAMAAAAQVSVAEALEAEGASREAQRHYARAVAFNPEHGTALDRLRQLASTQGPLAEPPAPEVVERCDQARKLAQEGSLEQALRLLEAVADEAPDAPLPQHYLANVHYLADDPVAALQHLELAVAKAPLDPALRQRLSALRNELWRRNP